MSESKVVLITGASSGIGLETALQLTQDGYRVFGTRLPGTPDEDWGFESLELDVRSDESVAACLQAVVERAGRVDVLVNNAAFGLLGPVEETSLAECQALFEVNYFGVVRMLRAALPLMRAQRSGLIINVGSVAGHIAVPFEAHYCATKHALDSLTRALRHEVHPFGVRVVMLAPGYVHTNFYDSVRQANDCLEAYDPGRECAHEAFQAAGRRGNQAGSIAQVIRRIIRSKSPRLRYWAGRDARLWGRFHRLISDSLADRVMQRKFVPR
jgi:NAD(P)-dependent dehydrogenase (short-subunit alcohol dehydrogenase family)